MTGNPDIVDEQVPVERGGGVVRKCMLCGGSWWLDEENHVMTHNYGCKYYESPQRKSVRLQRAARGLR